MTKNIDITYYIGKEKYLFDIESERCREYGFIDNEFRYLIVSAHPIKDLILLAKDDGELKGCLDKLYECGGRHIHKLVDDHVDSLLNEDRLVLVFEIASSYTMSEKREILERSFPYSEFDVVLDITDKAGLSGSFGKTPMVYLMENIRKRTFDDIDRILNSDTSVDRRWSKMNGVNVRWIRKDITVDGKFRRDRETAYPETYFI